MGSLEFDLPCAAPRVAQTAISDEFSHPCRFHDTQNWVTVFALEREVHLMACRVNRDGMSGLREMSTRQNSDLGSGDDHRDCPALGRDVEPGVAGVVGKYVGVLSDP